MGYINLADFFSMWCQPPWSPETVRERT